MFQTNEGLIRLRGGGGSLACKWLFLWEDPYCIPQSHFYLARNPTVSTRLQREPQGCRVGGATAFITCELRVLGTKTSDVKTEKGGCPQEGPWGTFAQRGFRLKEV